MFKRIFPALCLCFLTASAWSQTEAGTSHTPRELPAPAQADAPGIATEKILVVGKRPGPGLWKISKGDHVLWVFGTYSPLPKNMEWRAHEVGAILAQSQEILLPPSASPDVGYLRALTLLPYAIGLTRNPDDKQLRDVLPADVYASSANGPSSLPENCSGPVWPMPDFPTAAK